MTERRKARIRRWRWGTIADPWMPSPVRCRELGIKHRRVPHPLAARIGEPVREICRGRNGNALLEFEDGTRVVAPWRAAL